MSELPGALSRFFTEERLFTTLRVLTIVLLGLMLMRLLGGSLLRLLDRHLSPQHAWLLRRAARYTIFVLMVVMVLRELGLNLNILLGAAGILTVAVGFASQTSASNLISGLFLVAERPFIVGDVIKIGDLTGEVIAIDLLSVKIRTFDNLYARVPNESLIKSQITNFTHFPIRRVDMPIVVAQKEEIGRVKALLLSLSEANPLCLQEPAPVFIVNGYGAAGLDLKFCVWVKRENFLDLRNALYDEIKQAFGREGIEMPKPHLTLDPAALALFSEAPRKE